MKAWRSSKSWRLVAGCDASGDPKRHTGASVAEAAKGHHIASREQSSRDSRRRRPHRRQSLLGAEPGRAPATAQSGDRAQRQRPLLRAHRRWPGQAPGPAADRPSLRATQGGDLASPGATCRCWGPKAEDHLSGQGVAEAAAAVQHRLRQPGPQVRRSGRRRTCPRGASTDYRHHVQRLRPTSAGQEVSVVFLQRVQDGTVRTVGIPEWTWPPGSLRPSCWRHRRRGWPSGSCGAPGVKQQREPLAETKRA